MMVNTLICDVSASKMSRFHRPRVNMKTAFLENATLESFFKGLHVRSPKTPATCGRKVKADKNNFVFENIRHRVDRVLL